MTDQTTIPPVPNPWDVQISFWEGFSDRYYEYSGKNKSIAGVNMYRQFNFMTKQRTWRTYVLFQFSGFVMEITSINFFFYKMKQRSWEHMFFILFMY